MFSGDTFWKEVWRTLLGKLSGYSSARSPCFVLVWRPHGRVPCWQPDSHVVMVDERLASVGQLPGRWQPATGTKPISTLANQELQAWVAVNIECAGLFVCFLWGPRHRGAVGTSVNRYLTFRRCAGGALQHCAGGAGGALQHCAGAACHLAQPASQDCFQPGGKIMSSWRRSRF